MDLRYAMTSGSIAQHSNQVHATHKYALYDYVCDIDVFV